MIREFIPLIILENVYISRWTNIHVLSTELNGFFTGKEKKLNSAAEAKCKAESILVLAKLALQSNQIFRGKHTERRVICFFSFFLARENIVESRCESKVNFHFQEKQCLVEDDRCSVR